MCSDELILNLFRISQTNQKLKNDNIFGEKKANETHYNMGRDIRKFIKKQNGMMPETFKTPKQSLKRLESIKKIKSICVK